MKKKCIITIIFLFISVMLAFSPNKLEAECLDELHKNDNLSQHDQTIVVNSRLTEIDLENVNEIKVEENILIENIQNNSISHVSFQFDNVIRNLEIYNLTDPLNFVYEALSNTIIINLRALLDTNQTYRFYLSYTLQTELPLYSARKQSFYFFRYYPSLNYLTQYYRLCIKLPSKCFLHHFENSDSYHPKDATEVTEEYRTNIFWEIEEFQPLASFVFFVFFDEPFEGNTPIWVAIIAPLSGLLGGAAGVYWFMKRKEKKVLKEAVTTFLADDQKLLLRILVEADGKITQKEIIEKTGFTKSKTSRNLVPLEKNNLITKERWGREYKIFITEKGRKIIEPTDSE
ncbi:MAG: helix-turn-helix transcriptional regulator [Candidatus Heimdallarchaeaceae archaeon]